MAMSIAFALVYTIHSFVSTYPWKMIKTETQTSDLQKAQTF